MFISSQSRGNKHAALACCFRCVRFDHALVSLQSSLCVEETPYPRAMLLQKKEKYLGAMCLYVRVFVPFQSI